MAKTRTNQEWLHDLGASGTLQAAAVNDLRELLLKAALYFFSRNLDDFQGLDRDEILQRAEDCAQDAVLAVLNHLDDFRGDSKFSTWAYKFAINIAMMCARRERWKRISLDELAAAGDGSFFERLVHGLSDVMTPEQLTLRSEVRSIIEDVIAHELTEKQRYVLVLMLIQDVPLDEVVRHLGSNRNAVYKMLHDARIKIKRSLQAKGFDVAEILQSFSVSG